MLTDDSSNKSVKVPAKQKKAGWQGTDYNSKDNDSTIGGQKVEASTTGWTVTADSTKNEVIITPEK